MDDESSVIRVTQLMMAPANIPLNIIGMVTLTRVLNLPAPKDSAASSMDSGIWERIATEDLMVYGILLTHMAMTMMAAVPTSGRYLLLKARIIEIPTTAPKDDIEKMGSKGINVYVV